MQLNLVILAIIAALACIYGMRYRAHSPQLWSGPAAWLRAGIYFCFCLLCASVTGALAATLASPLVYPGQLQDPWWLLATAVILTFIIAAYWGYWYRNTMRFGRPLALLPQGLFGLCWGFTTGLLMLSFWHLARAIGADWPLWLVWLLAYGMISVWQALWMSQYWDVYISPEHDSPESMARKVPRTHIPNMTLCLSYFAVYENYWIFIGLQTIALLAASYGMRMPPPWTGRATPPATRVPGLLGLPKAGGYPGEPAAAGQPAQSLCAASAAPDIR